jgi:S1-C subfamily serine protease
MTYYPENEPRPRRSESEGAFLLRLLILLALATAVGFFAARWFERGNYAVQPRPITPRGDLSEEEKSTIAIFKQSNPSVVFITTLGEVDNNFGEATSEVRQGTGSGIIWDDAGDIVTNFHVVQDANSAQVTLWDHSSYPAQLVGVARDNDLAVVRINAPKEKLHPIPIGKSSDLQVGQKTFAIGDPFGLDQSLTTGIISALGRTMNSVVNTPIEDVIQTQAPINPGNSGGPLLDSAGRLIGVNTAILSPSGVNAGIGFAIPVDQVNRIVPQLIASGRVTRPALGVQFAQPISQEIPQELGVSGVLIVGVRPNTPAAAAGLRGTTRRADGTIALGDIIQKVDGYPISDPNQLFARLERYKPGDTVKLTIWRDGSESEVSVKLAAPGRGQK